MVVGASGEGARPSSQLPTLPLRCCRAPFRGTSREMLPVGRFDENWGGASLDRLLGEAPAPPSRRRFARADGPARVSRVDWPLPLFSRRPVHSLGVWELST